MDDKKNPVQKINENHKQKPVEEPKKTSKSNDDQAKKDLEESKKQLETCKSNCEEFKTKYLRALADYQNLENRVMQNNQQLVRNANANLLLKMLPFLDGLEKAEIFIKDQGLRMITEQFQKALLEAGLTEITVLNKEYDPYLAEVVDMVEGEKDNLVIEVLRKGYRFHDKVLRVAQVKVSKQKNTSSKSQDTNKL